MCQGGLKKIMGDFYSGIEELKNGCAFDKRYKGQMLTFDRPRIFIFTNTLPDYNLLSNDRWNAWVINSNMETIDYLTPHGDIEVRQKLVRDKDDNGRYNDDNIANVIDSLNELD